MSFNEAKTAQAAALVMSKCGSPINIMKLMKLLYLVDRASLAQHQMTITGDRMVSMPHGPVLSATLNVANGDSFSAERSWDRWIRDRSSYNVSLQKPVFNRNELDELSDMEVRLIEDVCGRYGHMDRWQLRDFTHDPQNCPEWVDPNGSSNPIQYATLFRAFGLSDEAVRELAAEQEEDAALDRLFAAL
jgi:uncharacterized phage-associated protein